MTSRPSYPVARIRQKLWSARWFRSARRCGVRATTRSLRRWWCATSGRAIRKSAQPRAAKTRQARADPVSRAALALAPDVDDLLTQYPLRELVTRGEQYGVWVDRPLARFGSWYEMFPRSTGGWDADGNPVHGTFATAAAALPR